MAKDNDTRSMGVIDAENDRAENHFPPIAGGMSRAEQDAAEAAEARVNQAIIDGLIADAEGRVRDCCDCTRPFVGIGPRCPVCTTARNNGGTPIAPLDLACSLLDDAEQAIGEDSPSFNLPEGRELIGQAFDVLDRLRHDAKKAAPLLRIVIEVDGGCVSAVYCSDPAASVMLIDHDNERAGDSVLNLDLATKGLTAIL